MSRRLALPTLLAVLAACAAPAPVPAPSPATGDGNGTAATGASGGMGTATAAARPAATAQTSGTYVLIRGGDTIATERFTRTDQRLEANLVIPGQVRVNLVAGLNPDASVSRLELRTYPVGAPDTAATQVSIAEFRADSVFLQGTREGGTTADRRPLMVSGVVPFVNPSPSLMEQIIRRARKMGGETAEVPVFASSAGGSTITANVHFAGNEAHLNLGGVQVTFQVDASGAVLGGSVPAQELTIQRVP